MTEELQRIIEDCPGVAVETEDDSCLDRNAMGMDPFYSLCIPVNTIEPFRDSVQAVLAD